ncbi:MFS general substrate transporter [Hymenopellis radicata]|nr:MFS general substrate transporter [Hymenopellis radicata]
MVSPNQNGWTSWGYRWRSSFWFVTFVVWLGVLTDLLVYSIIVPVIPFQLQLLGYDHVSTLTGWLLFAYSCGLVLCTVFVAIYAENYKSRQLPLVVGNVILIGSQIMFMEAPTYWLMCFARALQGIGSTMVWVIGLALICDVTPPELIGSQRPVSPFLKRSLTTSRAAWHCNVRLHFGDTPGTASWWRVVQDLWFRAPFVMGIIFAAADLLGRLLIIEKRARLLPLQSAPTNLFLSKTSLTRQLTFIGVSLALLKSSRAVTASLIALVFGIVAAVQDTVISLHLNHVWGLDSAKVGVVMLAAVVPTLFSGPLTGWISDKYGTSWVTFLSILLGIPWCAVMIIDGPLALFITSYALQSLFVAALAAPITVELAMVAHRIEGVGYAHVYSVFNFTFGLGSTVGPIIAGQMYDHIKERLDGHLLARDPPVVTWIVRRCARRPGGPRAREGVTTLGYRWRSSYWFVTLVVWLDSSAKLDDTGILTDLIVYSIIVPVIPFQLEKLGYTHISTLTGWLMFAYHPFNFAIAATVFVAMFADNYANRQLPLIVGNVMLIGSQIMFIEAPAYWLMCVARALQGIGSTMVWVVGLALILLLGPPVGGALYKTFGFRAPFILCIIFAAVDMVGRLLVIEVRPLAEKLRHAAADASAPSHLCQALTFVGAFLALVRSPRALTAGFIALVFGIIAALQDTVVALHLKDVWDADSYKVGLVMLAAVAPTFISTPLTGWAADKTGTAWPTALSLLLGVPWCGIMIIEGSLGLFITAYALQTPVTAELAMVAQSIEGVGYAHVYSVFNFAFGLGSTIGPIISGQMYDHITRGWMALCLMVVGLLAVCTTLSIIYIGEPSVYDMFTGKRRHK